MTDKINTDKNSLSELKELYYGVNGAKSRAPFVSERNKPPSSSEIAAHFSPEDFSEISDEAREIKNSANKDLYTPNVKALVDELKNYINTGMDNPQPGDGIPNKKGDKSSQNDKDTDAEERVAEGYEGSEEKYALPADDSKNYMDRMSKKMDFKYEKAKSYVEENPDAPDIDWVRQRISDLEDNGGKRKTGSDNLLDQYKGLWRS